MECGREVMPWQVWDSFFYEYQGNEIKVNLCPYCNKPLHDSGETRELMEENE
jgi:hypothetical protein